MIAATVSGPSRSIASSIKSMQALVQWYQEGKVKPAIDRTLPMAELKQAYAVMASRGVKGKLVLVN